MWKKTLPNNKKGLKLSILALYGETLTHVFQKVCGVSVDILVPSVSTIYNLA